MKHRCKRFRPEATESRFLLGGNPKVHFSDSDPVCRLNTYKDAYITSLVTPCRTS